MSYDYILRANVEKGVYLWSDLLFQCFFTMINGIIWVHYPSAGEKLRFLNILLDGEQCNFLQEDSPFI